MDGFCSERHYFTNPMIGLVSLFMLLLGLVGRYQFPFRLPAGLVVISLERYPGFTNGSGYLHG
ncbi:MAG: hypothetical protein U0401_26390 [Anaerolineae bacterium]